MSTECCCRSLDARRCYLWRYDLDEDEAFERHDDYECECGCHDEFYEPDDDGF